MDIYQFAKQAKNQRFSGNHHDGSSLLGYCFDNAFVTYFVLKDASFNPQIVVGASERCASMGAEQIRTFTSVKELGGDVHYWVEVNGTVVDIAAETYENPGQIYIDTELPMEYHRFSDSYTEAEETRKSALSRRCHYCGGRKYYCNCPNE